MSGTEDSPPDSLKTSRGLFHNPKVLQISFIFTLGLCALLFYLLQNAWQKGSELQKEVDYWVQEAKNSRQGLKTVLLRKPEELARKVTLAFLKEIYPDADGFTPKRLPDGGPFMAVTRGGETIGYAVLYHFDIECQVCRDVEVFIGVGLDGKVSGFSPVFDPDDSPDAKQKISEWISTFVGRDKTGAGAVKDVAGATKTSKAYRSGVVETLNRFASFKP